MKPIFDRPFAESFLARFDKLDRLSGNEDSTKAVQLIEERLAHCGVAFETHRFPCYVSNPGKAHCAVQAGGTLLEFEAYPRSFSKNVPQGLTAPLFFDTRAGDALTIEEENAWYAGVRGRVVFGANFYEDYVQKLARFGAAGLIHYWSSEEDALHCETVCPVWGTSDDEGWKSYPDFPVVGITHGNGLRILQALKQNPGAAWQGHITSQVETKLAECLLPVASIPGQGPEFVLTAGHYDSWFEGTTDNGTGNLLHLEIARLFAEKAKEKPLRRGLKIAWWPAHSNGRYAGSSWYCDTHFEALSKHCVALLNIDSPGCQGAEILDLTTCRYEGGAFDDIIKRHTGQETVQHDKHPRGSDLSFYGVRLPIVASYASKPLPENRKYASAGSGGGWWWHTTADRLDKVDFDILERDTLVAAEMLELLCYGETLPFDAPYYLAQFYETAREIDENSDAAFDFGPVYLALDRLKAALEGHPGALDDTLAKEVGGTLNMLLYTACDAYRYDNTFATGRLPGLQCAKGVYQKGTPAHRFLFLQTQFVRQRNRFVSETERLTDKLGHGCTPQNTPTKKER